MSVGPAPPSDGVHLPGSRRLFSGFGYIWVENSDGTITRITESDKSTATYSLNRIEAVTPEGVWSYDGDTLRCHDPATMTVESSVDDAFSGPYEVAYLHGALWMTHQIEDRLVRVSW